MVSCAVSFADDALVEFGMSADVLSDDEECCFCPIGFEGVEDERCGFRDRAVIKGEIDGPVVVVHSPSGPRVQPSEPLGGLFDNHVVAKLLSSCVYCSGCPPFWMYLV